MTHETPLSKLRNQLTPIYGVCDMLLMSKNDPEMLALTTECAKQAVRNADNIHPILQEINTELEKHKSLHYTETTRADLLQERLKKCEEMWNLMMDSTIELNAALNYLEAGNEAMGTNKLKEANKLVLKHNELKKAYESK